MSNLLGYLTSLYTVENTDPAHLSNFFLTFYSIKSKDDKGQDLKTPKLLNIFEKMFGMKSDTRVDLIEDILNYVVNCKTVPITQQVINSCFTRFLENANTSQAFQFYLNNILVQTSKM